MKRLFLMIVLVTLVFWISGRIGKCPYVPQGFRGTGLATFAHHGDTTRRFAASGGHQTHRGAR